MKSEDKKAPVKGPPPIAAPPKQESSGDKKFDNAIDRLLFGPPPSIKQK